MKSVCRYLHAGNIQPSPFAVPCVSFGIGRMPCSPLAALRLSVAHLNVIRALFATRNFTRFQEPPMGTVFAEYFQAALFQRDHRLTFGHGYRERGALDHRDQVGCFNFETLLGSFLYLINKTAYRLQDARDETGVGMTCSPHIDHTLRRDQ